MGSFSDFWENEILDHVFKTGAYTAPGTIYVSLHKTTVADNHTGATVPGEVSGGNYARVQCNTWDAAASGATENTQPVTFNLATADCNTVTHFAICDNLSSGNLLAWGALGTAKHIQSGDQAKFATGDIDVTLA